jgi:hypothetical protein
LAAVTKIAGELAVQVKTYTSWREAPAAHGVATKRREVRVIRKQRNEDDMYSGFVGRPGDPAKESI